MLKLPYGISDFKILREKGYYYRDSTPFIEKLESWPSLYHLFLRPRKFGKSLFISTLEYYYDLKHKDDFETLFGDLYIGKNPSPDANNFLVLRLDFSGIDTQNEENTPGDFCQSILTGIRFFAKKYPEYVTTEILNKLEAEKQPSSIIKMFFSYIDKGLEHRIFLLIDEYDQFTNELLSFDTLRFRKIVGQNGFVRKFYESLKEVTGRGVIGRIFITGVASVTLDSLTSGFNIIDNITLEPSFHDLLGFNHKEASYLLAAYASSADQVPSLLENISKWYNGYLFSGNIEERLFNPDMLLYFLTRYMINREYPHNMLDSNIMSDYRKVRSIFNIGGRAEERFVLLDKLLKDGYIDFELTQNFNLEGEFSDADFLSLLFYMGILTLREMRGSAWRFEIPNYVIKQLYFEYFSSVFLEKTPYKYAYMPISDAIEQLVDAANPEPFFKIVETVLTENHSNRDELKYNEKHLQTLMIGLLFPYKAFMIHSEYEAGRQYPDIFLERIPDRIMNYEVVLELKYLKKKELEQAEEIENQAKDQLAAYMNTERFNRSDVLGIWVLFAGGSLHSWGKFS